MSTVRDIILIAVILLVVGLSLVLIANTGKQVTAGFKSVSLINSTTEAVKVLNSTDNAINMSDYMYGAGFIGFFLAVIILGWIVGGSSVWAAIYFFVLVFFSFVAVILQLVWTEIASRPDVILSMTNFPITNYILQHLGYYTVLMGLIGIALMFAKPQQSGVSF